MKTIIAIALGGAAGALSRYGISWFVFKHIKTYFPVSTLTVNLLGAFLMGLLWGLIEHPHVPATIRIFVFIGFLGSFTTFSTFALDNYALLKEGKTIAALSNILITNLGTISLVFLGMLLSSWLLGKLTV